MLWSISTVPLQKYIFPYLLNGSFNCSEWREAHWKYLKGLCWSKPEEGAGCFIPSSRREQASISNKESIFYPPQAGPFSSRLWVSTVPKAHLSRFTPMNKMPERSVNVGMGKAWNPSVGSIRDEVTTQFSFLTSGRWLTSEGTTTCSHLFLVHGSMSLNREQSPRKERLR